MGGNFFLRDGDVYVIYGDSITDNAIYARMLENYVLTRFPAWNVTFYNYGWGGDVASNLFRYKRDVVPLKPTVFTDCMGMNDAGYSAVSAPRLESYKNSYRQIIPMLREANPQVRIGLVSAVPYENKFGSGTADGVYPQTLRCFAQAKRELARDLNVRFFDLFTGYSEAMGLAKVVYPDCVLSGDGVHPNVAGQTIMGMVILKAMRAPSMIAMTDLAVSGKAVQVTDTARCRMKDLQVTDTGTIRFSRLAEALPCPIEVADATGLRFLDVVNYSDRVNFDGLRITGLPAAAYELRINGETIDLYTPAELADTVNISKPMKGPLWKQAMSVCEATAERQSAHYTKWRGVWLKQGGASGGEYDLTDTKQIADLDARMAAAIRKQHELNQPKWMAFTLTPVKEKPVVLPEPVSSSAGAAPHMEPLDWAKAKVKMIDLRKVANRAFADEKPGDSQGGWSDQGPGNDLSCLPVGPQTLAGVPFDIIDPAKNTGKSMVVVSRRAGQGTPAQVTIPVGIKAKTLAFLHAGAWMSDGPAADMVIHYPGGLKIKTGFAPNLNIFDWWNTPNAMLGCVKAWKGSNRSTEVSIMYTPVVNPMPDAVIESVELSAPEKTEWVYGLIALTALE